MLLSVLTMTLFREHMDVVHIREPKYQCDLCSHMSISRRKLMSHRLDVHIRSRKNPCPICKTIYRYVISPSCSVEDVIKCFILLGPLSPAESILCLLTGSKCQEIGDLEILSFLEENLLPLEKTTCTTILLITWHSTCSRAKNNFRNLRSQAPIIIIVSNLHKIF